jgi:hypothetical protein
MSYAVFKDGDRISRPFHTEGDAWDCANDAGLVENVPNGGGSVQVLDGHCTIKSCDTVVMPGLIAVIDRQPMNRKHRKQKSDSCSKRRKTDGEP